MSGADFARPKLRRAVLAAFVELLSEKSNVELGDIIGLHNANIGRRGDDPGRWSLTDILDLVPHDARLAQALANYCLAASSPEGSSMSAILDLHEELQALGSTTMVIGSSLADGRLDRMEARELRRQLLNLEKITSRLDADLREVEAGR